MFIVLKKLKYYVHLALKAVTFERQKRVLELVTTTKDFLITLSYPIFGSADAPTLFKHGFII